MNLLINAMIDAIIALATVYGIFRFYDEIKDD